MADCSNLSINFAIDNGADIVSTTLSGYTGKREVPKNLILNYSILVSKFKVLLSQKEDLILHHFIKKL